MKENLKLRDAVRLALGLGAGVLAATTAPTAVAQQATREAPKEELTITGSRIKRADLDSASPITVINRDDMLSTGFTDVGRFLQTVPALSGSPINTTTNNGGDGSVEVDLRGMGVDRTLTLINGKRVVDKGDYQAIPALMIERIEILKDGASSVYGADAVAGVVNIITRKDFEGVEITAQNADYFDMDNGEQNSFGLIFGKNFDRGNFVFGAEYVDQKQAFQSDAPWDFFQDSYYIYPEGCENQVTAPYDGTPSGGCYPIGSSRIPESRVNFLDQGGFLIGTPASAPYTTGTMVPDDGRLYNYAPVNYIQTPYERTNIFAEGEYEVTENVRFNTQIRINTRTSAQELAPLPYDSREGFDPGYKNTFNSTAYNGISENNYYLRQAVDAYNLANGTALVYQPVTDIRRRMVETNRRFEQDVQQFQVVMGLEGEIRNMDWDVYYNRGERTQTDNDFGQFSGVRLFNAMGPSADLTGPDGVPDGKPECYTDQGTLIENCVPLNFFGGEGTITQDMLDYSRVDLVDVRKWRQDIVGMSLSGAAPIWEGGDFGWAVGYQYIGDSFSYKPDSGKVLDAVTGSTGAATDGSLYSNSIFGEVLVGVFDNGSQSVDLTGGLRYDDYNRFSSEITWQLGVEFQAIESVKLRATAGTVFRAPTIDDLFEGELDDAPTYSDPCAVAPADLPPGCDQVGAQPDTQVLSRVGGNPDLKPETGNTFTAGIVWTPEFFGHNQSLTVDYWQIDLEDGISSLGVQFTLDDCYVNQNAASCALITRDPADYRVVRIIDKTLNVADQGAKGVDTEFHYGWETGIGQWDAGIVWVHLLERTKTPFKGAPEQDLSGRYTDPTAEDGGAYAEDKLNLTLQWGLKGWTVGYLGVYISGLDADTFCNCGAGNRPDGSYIQKIDSVFYHDLMAGYALTSRFGVTSFNVGLTNLTDEEPPYIDIGFNATTDPSTYRLSGRGYYARLTHAFGAAD